VSLFHNRLTYMSNSVCLETKSVLACGQCCTCI